MRKEGSEHLMLREYSEYQRTYLTILYNQIGKKGLREIERRQALLRTRKDRKMWKALFAHILKGHGK